MDENVTLSIDDLLEKEFKIDARGYRPQEVDQFLDIVINDYTIHEKMIDAQEKAIVKLTKENEDLKKELRRIKANIEAAETSASNTQVSNIDLLRRLSQLEKVVYGKTNEE